MVARYYGNGAAALSANWGWGPLAVRVTRCGQPMANAPVQWTVTSGAGVISEEAFSPASTNLTTTTDSQGLARSVFRYTSPFSSTITSNEVGQVTATVGAQSVTFITTTFNSCGGFNCGYTAQPGMELIEPSSRDFGQVRAGTLIPNAFGARVYNMVGAQQGQMVPNVGFRLLDPADPALLAFSKGGQCEAPEGTVLTDSRGEGMCNLRVGTVPGVHGLRVMVGGLRYWDLSLTVVP